MTNVERSSVIRKRNNDFYQANHPGINNRERRQEQEVPMWDSFQCYQPKSKSGSMTQSKFYEHSMRIAKMLVYIILFVVMLIGNVVAKSSLLFATSNIVDKPRQFCISDLDVHFHQNGKVISNIPKEEQVMWIWCIILCFVIPESFGLLNAIVVCMFKKLKVPSLKNIAIVFFFETLHTVGLALFFIIALPNVDLIHAATLTSCVCILPGLCALLSRNRKHHNFAKYLGVILMDILALSCQLMGIIFYCFIGENEKNTPVWILPLSLILISFRWWSNYVSLDSNISIIRRMAKVKNDIRRNPFALQGITAIFRTGVFLLTAVEAAYLRNIEPVDLFNGLLNSEYNLTLTRYAVVSSDYPVQSQRISYVVDTTIMWKVLMINVASALLVYQFGKFACRTLMQRFGFALPLNLVTPVTVSFLIIFCILREQDVCIFHGIMPDYVFLNFSSVHTIWNFLGKWYAWIWLLWLFSQAWITIHTWSLECERLAATENIFCVPMYDSLLIEQSLALNRLRNDNLNENDMSKRTDDDVDVGSMEDTLHFTSNSSFKIPKIYACATMWHETDGEMNQLIGSILRLDMDQCALRFFRQDYKINVRDYYELEIHIFFDDAFCCMHGCVNRCRHNENETQINPYVMCLIETVKSNITRLHMEASPPVKYPTPYGGRLWWRLPGQTEMYVHLKDKNKIRHRKRWSQVMYMYYLLGFRLMELPIGKEKKQLLAENTYILTLDGDIDFRPSAVKTLLDLMKRDKDLGAACGRIHPIGKGPIVWYQKFEYAVGHWLQKSTEHMIGCVLCCPGCFSLFRAKALMEYNVLRKYATRATEAWHYVQYDQGEDRWLSTLILQMGYKIEYSAASDAYTHAPETFNDFFIQRRRWIPSTVANMLDLLDTAKETRRLNNDVSWLYILYQWILMGSTIIGPGTIFLTLVGAFVATFPIDNWSSFGYNLIPLIFFVSACFFCKERNQLLVAAVVTAIYGLVMIVVLVGIMLQIVQDGWVAPSTLLFFIVFSQLIITGLLHPQEWSCLLSGIIYYITVPSMYMILIIFSLFNVNNVTWGTRESKKVAETVTEEKDDARTDAKSTNPASSITVGKRKGKGAFEISLAGLFRCVFCTHNESTDEAVQLNKITESINRVEMHLNDLDRNLHANGSLVKHDVVNEHSMCSIIEGTERDDDRLKCTANIETEDDICSIDSADSEENKMFSTPQTVDNFLTCPYWLQDVRLNDSKTDHLSSSEERFWIQLIGKYLYPLDVNKEEQEKIAQDLKDLRNEYLFKFFMINGLFVFGVFLMQLNRETLHFPWPLGVKYNITYDQDRHEIHIVRNSLRLEPVGLLFIIFFVSILVIQFLAMLVHRFNTFSHLLTKVSWDYYCCNKTPDLSEEALFEKHAFLIAQKLQKVVDTNTKLDSENQQALIPPRRRKTIHHLVERGRREPDTYQDLISLFRRNLYSLEGEDHVSRDVVQMFERRRTTILNQERNKELQWRNVSNVDDDAVHTPRSRQVDQMANVNHVEYTNRAFDDDEFDFDGDPYEYPSSRTNLEVETSSI